MCGPTDCTAFVRCRLTHSQLVGTCRFQMWRGDGDSTSLAQSSLCCAGGEGGPFLVVRGGVISTGEKSEPFASLSWTILRAFCEGRDCLFQAICLFGLNDGEHNDIL